MFVTFTATKVDRATVKSWQTNEGQLLEMFGALVGGSIAADIVAGLTAGNDMDFPGTYSALQLTELGFRSF
jgi:hypothetical protein